MFSPKRGDTAFARGTNICLGRRVDEEDKVEAVFRGSNGDRGRKGAILVRTVDPVRRKLGAVVLQVELARRQENGWVSLSLKLWCREREGFGECGRGGR